MTAPTAPALRDYVTRAPALPDPEGLKRAAGLRATAPPGGFWGSVHAAGLSRPPRCSSNCGLWTSDSPGRAAGPLVLRGRGASSRREGDLGLHVDGCVRGVMA